MVLRAFANLLIAAGLLALAVPSETPEGAGEFAAR